MPDPAAEGSNATTLRPSSWSETRAGVRELEDLRRQYGSCVVVGTPAAADRVIARYLEALVAVLRRSTLAPGDGIMLAGGGPGRPVILLRAGDQFTRYAGRLGMAEFTKDFGDIELIDGGDRAAAEMGVSHEGEDA